MSKTLHAEMLETLNAIENDSHLESQAMSQAELAAVKAPKPRKRVDNTLLGIEGKRPPKSLTPSQLAFVDALTRGKGLRAAYREAYPNDTSADQTISAAAYTLTKHPRIAKLLDDAAEQTVEYMIDDAEAGRRWVTRQLMISATACKQEGSRLKALELVGRSLGMFERAAPVEDKTVSADQLKHELSSHMTLLDDVTPKRNGSRLKLDADSLDSVNDKAVNDAAMGVNEALPGTARGESDGEGQEARV